MKMTFAQKSVWMITAQVLNRAIAMLFSLYAARVLGVEGFGQYGFAIAFFSIFSIVAESGLFLHQVRVYPILKDDNETAVFLTDGIFLRLLLGVVTSLIFIAVGFLSGKPQEVETLFILLAIAMLCNTLLGSFSAILYSKERFGLYGLILITTQILILIIAGSALYMGMGLVGIGLGQAIAAVIMLAFSAWYVSARICRPIIDISSERIKSLFLSALPLGIMGILLIFFYRINITVLSYIKGDDAVGYYNASFQIINGLMAISSTFASVLLPRMSKYLSESPEKLTRLYRTAFRIMVFAGIGFAVGTVCVSDRLISFLYSAKYEQAGKALSVLIWVSALMFSNNLQGSLLVARNKNKLLVIMTSIAAALNLLGSFFMIQHYGYIGAAISVLAGEFFIWVFSYIINKEFMPPEVLFSYLWRAALAGGIMFTALKTFSQFGLYLLIPAGAILYILVLIVIGGFSKDDVSILKNLAFTSNNTGRTSDV